MRRRVLFVLGLIAVLVIIPGAASAHPLGNFTVSTSAGIVVSPGAVRIDYVVDLAEIPTVQAMPELDRDGDGAPSEDERTAWASSTAAELVSNLSVAVGGDPVALEVVSARAELLPGQGGLDVLRLEVVFDGRIPEVGELAFHDGNLSDRLGWHEVTASGSGGVALERSSVPATSPTDRLRTYPRDLLSSPLDVRDATLSFGPGVGVPAGSAESGGAPTMSGDAPSGRAGGAEGAFARVVDRTGLLMLIAVLLSFGVGALHALGPGHGKTLMAAYLIGSGGGVRHAVAVGGAVTVMHTASVLALGIVVLSATEVFAPEAVYPWLALGSGLSALALGAGMLVARLARWGEGIERHHDHPHPTRAVLSRKGLTALALAGGILPSPSALLVLLASVAIHRVAYGLVLIAAFSLGLASALVAVGILALRTRDALAHRLSTRLGRLVPVASAAVIAMLGLLLAVNGASRL
ncbi:MAG: High-affinity nickel-transporter [Actinomycetota bacterium]